MTERFLESFFFFFFISDEGRSLIGLLFLTLVFSILEHRMCFMIFIVGISNLSRVFKRVVE